MNIAEAEKFGSIGVALMVWRTEFERLTDELQKFMHTELDDQMQKVVGANDQLQKFRRAEHLHKSVQAEVEWLRADAAIAEAFSNELQKLSDCFEELSKLMDRRDATFGEYKRWATGARPTVTAGQVSQNLFEPKQPAVDLAKVSDTALRHRRDFKRD